VPEAFVRALAEHLALRPDEPLPDEIAQVLKHILVRWLYSRDAAEGLEKHLLDLEECEWYRRQLQHELDRYRELHRKGPPVTLDELLGGDAPQRRRGAPRKGIHEHVHREKFERTERLMQNEGVGKQEALLCSGFDDHQIPTAMHEYNKWQKTRDVLFDFGEWAPPEK